MKKKIFLFSVFILGSCGVIANLIILREILNILSGNELTIGMIFAHWLIIEALGVFFGAKLANKIKNKIKFFIWLHLLFFLLLVIQVLLIRNWKNLLGFSITETIPLFLAFLCSFFLIAPSALLHGIAFAFSCNLATFFLPSKKSNESIYIVETFGSIAGAILWTIWLAKVSNAFSIIFILFALMLCVLIFLLNYLSDDKLFSITKKFTLACYCIFLLLLICLFFNVPSLIHQTSLKCQWKGHKIVEYKNSKFNTICVIENQNQYFFFLNGVYATSFPIPDTIYVEEFVNIPIFIHPAPENILIIGNGYAGLIEEILKHKSIKKIDYAEPDPTILELTQKYCSTASCDFRNPKINISKLDGLRFLKKTHKKYDIIFLGVHEPTNLQSNRFFTDNFFFLVNQKLNDDGIFVLAIPGSFSRITDEIKKVNTCIYSTLKAIFTNVRPLPGDGRNIFLASRSEIIWLEKEKFVLNIAERLKSENVKIPKHIEQRLHPALQNWFNNFIFATTPSLNTLTKPTAVFYTISGWNKTFAPKLYPVFLFLEHHSFLKIFLIAILPLIFTYCAFFATKNKSTTITLTIAINGFVGTSLYLATIFIFQSTLGNIIELIGILSATFLLGNMGGAFLCFFINQKSSLEKIDFFLMSEICYLCLCLAVFFVFLKIHTISNLIHEEIVSATFYFMCLMTGSLSGFQFSTTNQLHLENHLPQSISASIPYAADLGGACLGSLTLSIIFFPLLGLTSAFVILLTAKFICILFCYLILRH